nr:MAG: wsv414-like protein [Marsupenaeus japonicus pemonivirus]
MPGPVVTQSGEASPLSPPPPLHRDLNGGDGRNCCISSMQVMTVMVILSIFIIAICNVHFGPRRHVDTGMKKHCYVNRYRDIGTIIACLIGLITSVSSTYMCFRKFNNK